MLLSIMSTPYILNTVSWRVLRGPACHFMVPVQFFVTVVNYERKVFMTSITNCFYYEKRLGNSALDTSLEASVIELFIVVIKKRVQ